ncbi:VCBS repeat-containing protein, partial [Nodularia spumigena CS-587/03]|nr:VCBS repeat-containing protein [Nodularia spumigena CS-587/03]
MFGQQNSSVFEQTIKKAFDNSLAKSAFLLSDSSSELNTTLPSSSSSSQFNSTATIPNLFGGSNPNPNPYLTSAAIVPDFNGDGKTDKLWVNAETGEIVLRLMDGTRIIEEASLGQYDLSSMSYKIADFNGDGKTDFLLRNQTTGDNRIVLMDGTRVANTLALESVDPNWTASIGDFNGDRKTDIFWHSNQSGQNAIWTMDGTTVVD